MRCGDIVSGFRHVTAMCAVATSMSLWRTPDVATAHPKKKNYKKKLARCARACRGASRLALDRQLIALRSPHLATRPVQLTHYPRTRGTGDDLR